MRFATELKFKSTFTLYRPVVTNGVTTYQRVDSRNGMLSSVILTAVALITKEQMPVGWVVREVTDVAGNPVFVLNGEPYDMYITKAEPVMNPQGVVVAWKHSLGNTVPRDVQAQLLAIAGGLNA